MFNYLRGLAHQNDMDIAKPYDINQTLLPPAIISELNCKYTANQFTRKIFHKNKLKGQVPICAQNEISTFSYFCNKFSECRFYCLLRDEKSRT